MKRFNCIPCGFHTNHKPNFERHLGTIKHLKKNESHPKVTIESPESHPKVTFDTPKVTRKSPKNRPKTTFFAQKMKKRTNHWKKRTIYINVNIV